MTSPAWHVCVLIPARNEEELLPRCLRSVLVARAALPPSVTCDVVIAVDSSRDRTLQIASRMVKGCGVVVCTEAGVVGHARSIAVDAALARYGDSHSRCWLANTDADCAVPPSWLNDQLLFAANRVEAVAGIVDVDTFADYDPIVEQRFRATYLIRSDGSHPHVHGANFGVRADTYLRAGGWNDIPTAEDHDLWNRLSNVGARKVSASRIRVVTSGRRVGRAPHGFAGALAAHGESAA